jgi:hypothetical protein
MTFLAPAFFYASLGVAAAITALHFIVTRQPRAGILPTARFVPDMPATATARATRPSDIPLLVLRVLLVLAVGAGLAKPVIKPSRSATARVVLADVSRSVGDISAIRTAVDSAYREGDVLIAFDSSARIVADTDSLTGSGAEGNISAALIAAMRAGSDLRERADSVELVVISPLAAATIDAATERTRALWPGAARVILAGRPSTTPAEPSASVTLRTSASDAFSILAARLDQTSGVVVVRDGSVTDSPNMVSWPISERPRGAVARPVSDTIGGVVAGEAVVVSGFVRRWTYPADSIANGTVVARWIDGEPAAVEWTSGDSCIRSVAIPVNQIGDFVIRDDVTALASRLTAPCITSQRFVPVSEASLAMLRGEGGLVARDAFAPRRDARSALAPWLIGLALILAVAELFLRRRRAEEIRALERSQRELRSAA